MLERGNISTSYILGYLFKKNENFSGWYTPIKYNLSSDTLNSMIWHILKFHFKETLYSRIFLKKNKSNWKWWNFNGMKSFVDVKPLWHTLSVASYFVNVIHISPNDVQNRVESILISFSFPRGTRAAGISSFSP